VKLHCVANDLWDATAASQHERRSRSPKDARSQARPSSSLIATTTSGSKTAGVLPLAFAAAIILTAGMPQGLT
jgi:hypothetical protein